ncbi:zinc finger protein 665-like [Armigeres subalbatus]|uniref:zinc finger protein 665-like n=1 Tax=Armigeres subalbatus TaxID=124917 RepID=UPI002ED38D0B
MATDATTMDICRLCAATVTESTSIFSERNGSILAEMVFFVSAVKINRTDPVTSLVCADCVELTLDAFQFVTRIREVDQHLRQFLSEPDVSRDADCSKPVSKLLSSDHDIAHKRVGEECDTDIQEDAQNQFELVEIVDDCLEDEPEVESKKLISLLIESVNDTGSQKWSKIMTNYADIIKEHMNLPGNDLGLHDEAGSSEEEESSDFEPKHIDYNPRLKGEEQSIRCCRRGCRLVFKTRDELLEHGSSAHVDNRSLSNTKHSYECVICFQRFESRRNLLCHLRRLVRDYRCNFCNIYFNAPQERTSHMRSNHPILPKPSYRLEDQPVKICCGCEEMFDNVAGLIQHGLEYHSKQPTYPGSEQGIQCGICYKFFKTKASLRNHQIMVYKPKNFACHTCGKAFECLSKLTNHETTHTTERKFACSICEGTFKTATDLRGHQRIHQEKNLACNVCGAKFRKKSQLTSHRKTHDDNAYEFACSLCPRKFKEKSNWKTHLKVHTQEKPYKCEYCPKAFRYVTDRKRHEMSHTGNYPYHCVDCGKAFTRGNLLQAHMLVCGNKEGK